MFYYHCFTSARDLVHSPMFNLSVCVKDCPRQKFVHEVMNFHESFMNIVLKCSSNIHEQFHEVMNFHGLFMNIHENA